MLSFSRYLVQIQNYLFNMRLIVPKFITEGIFLYPQNLDRASYEQLQISNSTEANKVRFQQYLNSSGTIFLKL